MSNPDSTKSSILRSALKVLIPFLILLAGGAIAKIILATGPEGKKTAQKMQTPAVLTISPRLPAGNVSISVMGTVIPAREVVLTPEVSGRVVWMSDQMIPGGHFQEGEDLLRLDDAEYRLAVLQKKSAVDRARAGLAIEKGQQAVAREELALVESSASMTVTDTDLALRKPYLDQVEADLASAEAALSEAELDLSRTRIRSPFNAVITAKNVDIGARVTTGFSMLTLVGTDTFWVEARVPADRLNRLTFPSGRGEKGSRAVITTSGGLERTGYVILQLPDLTETSRLARILVAVDDPLGLSADVPPLFLSGYVSMTLEITPVPGALQLPRSALREGGTVWIYDSGKLEIRPVTVAWKEGDNAWITGGLSMDDPVIVSDLTSPVAGMPLTTETELQGETEAPSPPGAQSRPDERRAS